MTFFLLPLGLFGLFPKKNLAEKFHPVANASKRVRLFHFLVTPYDEDARQYAKVHKYSLLDCKTIRTEADLIESRPPLGQLKLHYLRGWEKLPQEVLARLRAIEKRNL